MSDIDLSPITDVLHTLLEYQTAHNNLLSGILRQLEAMPKIPEYYESKSVGKILAGEYPPPIDLDPPAYTVRQAACALYAKWQTLDSYKSVNHLDREFAALRDALMGSEVGK